MSYKCICQLHLDEAGKNNNWTWLNHTLEFLWELFSLLGPKAYLVSSLEIAF